MIHARAPIAVRASGTVGSTMPAASNATSPLSPPLASMSIDVVGMRWLLARGSWRVQLTRAIAGDRLLPAS